MYSWEESFALCERVRELHERNSTTGPLVNCTRTFTFLPLRYGAVGGNEAQRGLLPFLPPHLNRPAKVGRLSESGYALRPLREGFLYLLVKRIEEPYVWDSQYRVSDVGTLEIIDPDNPWAPPAPAFVAGQVKGLAWVLRVHDMDSIEDLRFLYSPVPLTQKVRDQYRQLSRYRDSMTAVDVAAVIAENPPRLDGILAHDALELVADLAAENKPGLKDHLKSQAFQPLPPPWLSVRAEMKPAAGAKAQRGVAVVLDDTLGLVQELNAWRNASSESLEAFMAQEDDEKIDNQRKFTIAFAIDNIRKLVEDDAQVRYYDHQKHIGVRYTDPEYQAANRHAVIQSAGNYQSFRNPAHQRQVQEAAAKAAREESWGKYAGYIDEAMRQAFLARYRVELDKADTARNDRTADHLLWLQSEQLLQALEVFDRDDTEQALLFEDQIGKAIAGMNATEAGEALLERWRDTPPARENLFWRSLAQNQEEAEAEVDSLFQARGELEEFDSLTWQDRLKKLTVVYDRAHAFMDTLAEGASGPPSSYLVGGALLINTLGNSLFQNKAAAMLDKTTNKVAAAVLQAHLGRYAQSFQLEMRGGRSLSRGTLARIDRAAARSFDEALRAGTTGPMSELRLGGVLVFLEMWNLSNRLSVEDKQSRQYIEAVAALLAVTAAGVELGAAAVAFGTRSSNAAVQQGAKVFGGGLRLGAGILAGAAGVVGAWYDGQDAVDSRNLGKHSIAALYALRASAQMGAATLSITVGLAYAKPYFEYLLKRYGTQLIIGKVVNFGVQGSTALAARMVPMLRLFLGVNIAILALLLVEIYLFPNSLQRYLDHCTFRKERSNGVADTREKEVEIMQRAIEGTL